MSLEVNMCHERQVIVKDRYGCRERHICTKEDEYGTLEAIEPISMYGFVGLIILAKAKMELERICAPMDTRMSFSNFGPNIDPKPFVDVACQEFSILYEQQV